MILSNQNESNPNRDPTALAYYRVVEEDKEAQADIEKAKLLHDAQSIFFAMNDAEILKVCSIVGISVEEESLAKKNLLNYVIANPSKFLNKLSDGSESIDLEVLVTKAISQNLLIHIAGTKEVLFGEDNKVIYKYVGGKKKKKELADHLLKEFPEVIESLKIQVE